MPNDYDVRLIVCGPADAGKTTLIDCLNRESGEALDADDAHVRRLRFGKRVIAVAEPLEWRQLVNLALSSDVAMVVLDSSAGAMGEARRIIHMLSVLGLRRIILAANKLDRVEDSREAFGRLEHESSLLARRLGLDDLTCLPVSALCHQSVFLSAKTMSWYRGPSLIDCVTSLPLGRTTSSPHPDSGPTSAAHFEATIVWTSEQPMLQGRVYSMAIGERTVSATLAPLKYRVDADTFEQVPAKTLNAGEIGVCHLEVDASVSFEPFHASREHGTVSLLDRETGLTLGTGLLNFALRRSQNVHWQVLEVDRAVRARLKGQRPCVIWFTGLSGAGKSTVANLVEGELHAAGRHTYLLDGDNVRHGLNKDLGFTAADRVENIRRIAEVARLMADAGLIVLVSCISPFRAERRMARELMEEGAFIEVFVDAPLAVAEARDPKGLYRKARSGTLKNFTGVDSPYELPECPEVHIDTVSLTPSDCCEQVLDHLRRFEGTSSTKD